MNYEDVEALREELAGEVVLPGNATYQDLSSVFGKVGTPALIVRCADADDVSLAIGFARKQGLAISLRSGGHGITGSATNDGGLVIDFSLMRQIEVVDEKTRLVRIQPGATWGEVAEALQPYELSLSSGDNSTVGVGGLTVGGGIGWMVRKYGLTIDALVAAEVVLADGSKLRVSHDENPDLFWAIRGGGSNFGAVTSFEFIALPEAQVVFGSTYYDISEAQAVLKGWSDYAVTADEGLSTILMVLPPQPDQPALVLIMICYAGSDLEKAKKVIEPLMGFGNPLGQQLTLMSYAQVVPNRGPAHFGAFNSLHHTTFLPNLDDETIAFITEHYGKAGSPTLQLRGLGGAVSRVEPDATAFAHRKDPILAIAMKVLRSGESATDAAASLEKAWGCIAAKGTGSYLNFNKNQTEEGVGMVYPKGTYQRLATIKAAYDPDNLFNSNHNIPPAKP